MSPFYQDLFGAKTTFNTGAGPASIFKLEALEKDNIGAISSLPISIKVLLESILRNCNNYDVAEEAVVSLANWKAAEPSRGEVPFKPARVLLQDFTGVPAIVDLAAMREAIVALGGDAERINPLALVELVIDHSVQVDVYGSAAALARNNAIEFARNRERYAFLRWGQNAFDNFKVVPPNTGIVHQVNIEYLARVVFDAIKDGERVAYPDTVVGTDSHTTMVNGLGVLGWGVGGIEAEAAMLGQPIYLLAPPVVGFELTGQLPEGATATDLVLVVTQVLRERGVVGRFVEFHGEGLASMSVPDRATLANMAPEYGATCGFFPIDDETLRYLQLTGRPAAQIALVEAYSRAQGLFRADDAPQAEYSELLELDLGTVEPSLAGPKRPQDRISLSQAKPTIARALHVLQE